VSEWSAGYHATVVDDQRELILTSRACEEAAARHSMPCCANNRSAALANIALCVWDKAGTAAEVSRVLVLGIKVCMEGRADHKSASCPADRLPAWQLRAKES
jgi:hypothetical protein